jgi:ROS/MUCR transcriptional regulator protein
MTPEQYRTKWNLSSDYPMVAPSYAAQRSALAKALGLGQLRQRQIAKVAAAPPTSPVKIEAAAVAAPSKATTKRKSGRARRKTA